MDLEFLARDSLRRGLTEKEAVRELTERSVEPELARAVVREVRLSGQISDSFLSGVLLFEPCGVDAKGSSLGCRGAGDFHLHRRLAEVIGTTGAEVDATEQDDGGAVGFKGGQMVVAVDGMHSRLSHFPFLAGFHAARAALRDVVVMGAKPLALVSDIHLANDGDVSKVFDYTAGISAVGELLDVPLIAGSTLRIGGDMVLGDRLTGCAGAVGWGERLTPRRAARPGDVLLMSMGHGGGTIATTAIFNGMHDVAKETLNIDFLKATVPLLDSGLLDRVHAMTDVTNGGIRGDAFELSRTAGVGIELDHGKVRDLVNPRVLAMLDELEIDPLGVSIDSLLVVCPPDVAKEVQAFLDVRGLASSIVGKVVEGSGVSLFRDGEGKELDPQFREAPYTPVKKVVGVEFPEDWTAVKEKIDRAAGRSRGKKRTVKEFIASRGER